MSKGPLFCIDGFFRLSRPCYVPKRKEVAGERKFSRCSLVSCFNMAYKVCHTTSNETLNPGLSCLQKLAQKVFHNGRDKKHT